MSNWIDALRIALVCPKCGASNRPGAYAIELESDGMANCTVCAHAWKADLLTRSPK